MEKYNFKTSKFQTYVVNRSTRTINDNNIVYIFWTGGWDSSFRVLQLSSKDVIIQPIYLDDNRTSVDYELKAIDKIANFIAKQKTTNCTLLELKIIDTKDVYLNDKITSSYNRLLEKKSMGSQYDWLARFSIAFKGIELCIHEEDRASIFKEKCAIYKKISDKVKGDYYVLDDSLSSDDMSVVFGNYHFPLLKTTKLDMKHEAECNGYIDILNQSWFCFTPINGKACGLCNPCIYTIKNGMQYRFNLAALLRFRTRNVRKMPKKIRGLISVTLEKMHLLNFAKKVRDKLYTR
ncbi:hypothetical protein [Arsukibacterium perlucidum]|uniref:hypothetical protein n=1 Tax=Arsukibacterium perlucidum TaxID=368811 RepID=UPI000368F908|nr:hypothetical protein [Arsukibacterium perlucidum]